MISGRIGNAIDRALWNQLLVADDGSRTDFTRPAGEPALIPADSVSWTVFGNPVSLFIGGITAVLLELAEPRIRTGVWDHTTFRTDPLRRMRRTGLAAMITVYAGRSSAERMIAGVRRMHEKVRGTTPCGTPYRADDPELLRWVHATAAFGFLEAYQRYVRPLPQEDRDRYYAEGAPVAALYGAATPPSSEDDLQNLFSETLPALEASPIIGEFLSIMNRLPLVPGPLTPLNRPFVNAAVGLLPPSIREILGLEITPVGFHRTIRSLGRFTETLDGDSSPSRQAEFRLSQPSA